MLTLLGHITQIKYLY